jgi:hypothetical protein
VLLSLVTLCAAGVTFSGVNEKIETAAAAQTSFNFANTKFSVCFWFQSTQTGTVTGVGNKKPNSAGQGWAIQANLVNTKLSGVINDSVGTHPAERETGTTVMTDGTERHVCMVFVTSATVSATNDITYVNGVLTKARAVRTGPPMP